MTVTSGSKVEVRLPSRLGFEKVAMSTAAGMAKLMGFSEDRIEDPQDRRSRGLHQRQRSTATR
jgi:hypothetical protein